MCTREEIHKIVSDVVGSHEKREVEFHKLIMKNHDLLSDKLEQTLIIVRDSTPPSLSHIIQEQRDRIQGIEETLAENGEKLSTLINKVSPVTRTLDTAGNIKVGVIWISGLLIAFYGIIESIKHIKDYLK